MNYDTSNGGRTQQLFASTPALILRAVSLVLIAVAVVLNFNHTLASTSSVALALAAGSLGILGPAALHGATHAKTWGQSIAVIVIGLFCLSVCLASAVASSVTLRGDGVAQRAKEIDAHKFLTGRKTTLLDELAALGNPRAPSIIQADIAAAPVSAAIMARSQQCADISRDDTKKACEPILKLRQEQGRAARKAELEPQIAEVETQLRALRPAAEADGQSAGMAWMFARLGFAVDMTDIARFNALLFAVALEVGAAGGLIVAGLFDHAVQVRIARRDEKPTEAPAAPSPVAAPTPVVAVPAPVVVTQRSTATEDAILAAARSAGGKLMGTQRTIAEKLTAPKSTVGAALKRLVDQGVLRAVAGGYEIETGLRVVRSA